MIDIVQIAEIRYFFFSMQYVPYLYTIKDMEKLWFYFKKMVTFENPTRFIYKKLVLIG